MRKAILLLSILGICLLVAPSVIAQGIMDWTPPWVGEIPELTNKDWAVGQYVTYKATVTAEGVSVDGSLRVALVGKETIEDDDYYWLEIDLFDIGDLPEDLGAEEFESFKLKILMQEYDLSIAESDPNRFMDDFLSMEFIRRVIFQLNDDTPQEFDLSFLEFMKPMMEAQMDMAVEEMESEDTGDIQEALDDIDWGLDYLNVSTPAGSFPQALNLWLEGGDETGEGRLDLYAADDLPICSLVKLEGSFSDNSSEEEVFLNLELIEYGDDAGSWVEGEPELFSFDAMMGGMGDMGGFGELEDLGD